MIKKLQLLALSLLSSITLLVPAIALPVMVHAATPNIQNSLCEGSDLQATGTLGDASCQATTGQGQSKVNQIITTVINVFSFVVGVTAVIMIIVGGFRYVLSGGDSAAMTSARNTILYALVGLVIVALAQIIVKFVLNRVTTPA